MEVKLTKDPKAKGGTGMKKYIPVLALFYIFMFNIKVNAQANVNEVHLMDIGQSDCILIKGTIKNYLIDTGLPRTYDKVLSYLNAQGISKLDTVIVTHYHDDHYGGLEKLIKDKNIDKVILPAHQPTYRDFIFSYLKDKGIKVEYITSSFSIVDNNIDLRAAVPYKEDRIIENNNSTVLYGTIDGIKYAFLADVEKEREKVLLDNKELYGCDVVKVPHHALYTSSTEEMVEALRSRIAIVSCDGDESPTNEVIERYTNMKTSVFRTDMHGNIVLKAISGNKEIEIIADKVIQ
jgi:beta-lactamase superfamily II metal-dependent hydrolase